MAVNDVYQADLLYSVKGEKCANVLFFREGTDPGANSEQHLAAAVSASIWDSAIKLAVSNDCQLQKIRVRRVDPTAGGPIETIVNVVGSVAQDTLPPNSTALITLYTGRLDRSGRGRLHVPGIPKTHNKDGLIVETEKALYDAIGTTLLTNITDSGGSWTPGIWSRSHSEFNQLVSFVTRPWLHTLRSRRMAAP